MKRTALGRGLDALIPGRSEPPRPAEPPPALDEAVDALVSSPSPVIAAPADGLIEVDIDLVAPNPKQPRTVFEVEQLADLAASIREHGIIQPLIVSRVGGSDGATYQLIAGERRLLGARQAGLHRVPVIVREATPQEQLELAIVENLQRADLGPLEEAAAFRRLADEFALTQEAIATRVGRSRSAITNSLRLLSLPDEIQASLARNEITAGHARAILGVDDPAEQRRVWQRIVEAGLNVREAEALVRQRERATPPPRPRRVSADLLALEEGLRSSLGTKVELIKKRNGGRITLYFYSDEELDTLVQRLS